MLTREAFLQGTSTRPVGLVLASLTEEAVSRHTVSKATHSLDRMVKAFHRARLKDEWVYLFMDGVCRRVRRPAGPQRVQMLVAYGVRVDGSRQLLCFLHSRGESQAAWEGLVMDLYRHGLGRRDLNLIITDECEAVGITLQTVDPEVLHQRCWVHKMGSSLEKVRKRDYDWVRADAQTIYRVESRQLARAALRIFRSHWRSRYPGLW